MEPSPTNHDARLEQIVAYLDGELSPADEARLQRQLAEDPALRQEVQGLDRAWGALDALPGVTVDDRFAQTTLELVVDAAEQELAAATRALPIRRRRHWLANALVATAAALLGWLGVQLLRENPNRTLLADLPAIQYIDTYSQFPDVAFLRQLHENLGDTPWASELTADEGTERTQEFATVSDPAQRAAWLDTLEPADRSALRGRYNHFLAVSQAEQARLRTLHESIATAADRAELVETLLAYQAWLNTLPASQQFELRELPPAERAAEIVAAQRREGEWISLSADELRQLRRELPGLRQEMLAEMSPPQRERFESAGPGGKMLGLARRFPEWSAALRTKALEILSDDHRTRFDALSPDQQQEQLQRWLREVLQRGEAERIPGQGRRWNEVSQEELERFFAEDLDAATRERLLALPRERMEQQLRGEYLRGSFSAGDGPGWEPRGPQWDQRERGPGPPPRDGRGRGPGRGRGGGPREDRPAFGRFPPDGPPPPPPGDAF